MRNEEWEEIEIKRIVHMTAKAILVEIDESQFWIPKSQIYRVDDYRRGYSGPIEVAAWWLEANDLEHLMDERPDPWELPAAFEDAHRIYRRLATKYHPDRSPETAEMMKDLNELWQSILAIAKKR
jgi:hypothetical protein